MPKMPFRHPLGEFKLPEQHGFQPHSRMPDYAARCVASVFISEVAVSLFGILRAADVSKPYATWARISVQCVRALVRFVDRQTRIRFLKAHRSRLVDCSKIFRNLLDLFRRFILNQTA